MRCRRCGGEVSGLGSFPRECHASDNPCWTEIDRRLDVLERTIAKLAVEPAALDFSGGCSKLGGCECVPALDE
jgi:hypothetical protein